jgi:predicted DNA-binding transcriptional regulator AlpA
MWTTEQVLEFLGISRPTLRKMMRASETDADRPWVRIGNRFRWSEEPAEIRAWVQRMEAR